MDGLIFCASAQVWHYAFYVKTTLPIDIPSPVVEIKQNYLDGGMLGVLPKEGGVKQAISPQQTENIQKKLRQRLR